MGPAPRLMSPQTLFTDSYLRPRRMRRDVDRALFESLQRGLSLLSGLHPFAANRFKDMGYQLQRSAPGDFYRWHVDAPGPDRLASASSWPFAFTRRNERRRDGILPPAGQRATRGRQASFVPTSTHLHQGQTVESELQIHSEFHVGLFPLDRPGKINAR